MSALSVWSDSLRLISPDPWLVLSRCLARLDGENLNGIAPSAESRVPSKFRRSRSRPSCPEPRQQHPAVSGLLRRAWATDGLRSNLKRGGPRVLSCCSRDIRVILAILVIIAHRVVPLNLRDPTTQGTSNSFSCGVILAPGSPSDGPIRRARARQYWQLMDHQAA